MRRIKEMSKEYNNTERKEPPGCNTSGLALNTASGLNEAEIILR
jgi:hypothetical protein